MTKKCVAWLVLLFVFCSLTVTAWAAPAGSTFCDEVGVVTSAEAEAITQRLEALCDTYKVQVCIAVGPIRTI